MPKNKNGTGKRITVKQAKHVIFGVPLTKGDCNLRRLGKLTNDEILNEFHWLAYANARNADEREDAVFFEHLLSLGWKAMDDHHFAHGGYDLKLKLTVTNVCTKKSGTYVDAPSDH